MRASMTVLCVVLCLSSSCSEGDEDRAGDRTAAAASEPRTTVEADSTSTADVLRDEAVGYSISYPRGWRPAGAIVATEFAANADCRSVEIVDLEPPPDAGPGAQVLHSLVQVCSRRLTDGARLEEFLRRTYGELLARFRPTSVGNARAFTTGTAANSTAFLQTGTHRLQVVTAVVAEPGKYRQRNAEVEEILEGFSLGP